MTAPNLGLTPRRSPRRGPSVSPLGVTKRDEDADSPRTTASSSSSSQNSSYRRGSPTLILYVTYINIALYALCYQLQRPVEPFLVQKLSLNSQHDAVARTYGQLQSFFSTIQTIGSPLVGILLDRVGVRYASVMVFTASALSYLLLAGADDIFLLFMSKIPTALQHAFLVAQATAASAAKDDATRAQALGRMTTAYTFGATIGPLVGGLLAERGDLYIGAKLAVLGSLVSVLLSLIFLPNRTTTSRSKKVSLSQDLSNSFALLFRDTLWPLLIVKVLSGVASSMLQTTLPIVLTQQLKFDPASLGFSMSSAMLAVAAFGAVGMAPLTSVFGTRGLAKTGLILRAALGLVLASAVVVPTASTFSETALMRRQIMVTNVLHHVASHALATSVTTQTTGAVEPEEQGALLGLEHGLFSLARIGGPPLGTSILSNHGFLAVTVACGGIDVALAVLLVMAANRQILGNNKSSTRSPP